MTPERAVKMLMAGASLVQLYTVLHEKAVNGPQALDKFSRGLKGYMAEHGIESVRDIRGAALPLLEQATELTPQIPLIDTLGCVGCNACVRVCLPEAFIEIPANNKAGHVVAIDGDSCVGCGHCVTQCPIPDVLTMPNPVI